MNNVARADWLFTREGFWKSVFPAIVSHCLTGVAIAYVSVKDKGSGIRFLAIVSGLVVFLFIVDLVRYSISARRHKELQNEFGQEYMEWINRGDVIMNANSILLLGAPDTFARRILNKKKKNNI